MIHKCPCIECDHFPHDEAEGIGWKYIFQGYLVNCKDGITRNVSLEIGCGNFKPIVTDGIFIDVATRIQ
jgi:hypothetical protein